MSRNDVERRQGIIWNGRDSGSGLFSLYFGLVLDVRDGDVVVVPVVPTSRDGCDPRNVLLGSCPPPFEYVCFYGDNEAGGLSSTRTCDAIAVEDHVRVFRKEDCDVIDDGAKVSEADFKAVLDALCARQPQKEIGFGGDAEGHAPRRIHGTFPVSSGTDRIRDAEALAGGIDGFGSGPDGPEYQE